MIIDRSAKPDLENIVRHFTRQRMLVVGDLVLDQFLQGIISRISREAPVLILRHDRTLNSMGGGANAAHNLKTLGAEVEILGHLGEDESGELLLQLFEKAQMSAQRIVKDQHAVTTTKTRIMGGLAHASLQQMVRVDREGDAQLSRQSEESLIRHISNLMDEVNGVVVSDYGYGVVTIPVLEALKHHCRRRKLPLIVDSRFRMNWFSGVTAITPNITEVEEAYGKRFGGDLAALEACARQILQRQDLEALLVTRGKFGMSLFQAHQPAIHLPIFGSDEVTDVTGAGDTVIAAFTLALTAGASFLQAAQLSNIAGGIVVMKRGTATVASTELLSALSL